MALDEKKHVIVPLLDTLRPYNHLIGSYEKSMLTEWFDYSVKLSNGTIQLPSNLVDDYENAPGAIRPERFRAAANGFVPVQSIEVSDQRPSSPEGVPPPAKEKSRSAFGWLIPAILTIAAVLSVLYFVRRSTLRAEYRDNARLYVTLSGSPYQYRIIGGISSLKLTVENSTDFTMDMVRVRVAYIKQGGGVYKYEEVDFPNVGAHSQETLPAPDSDRGTSVTYEIASISCGELGL